VLELFLREYRTHRMARFTVWVLAYGVGLGLEDRLTRSSGGAPGVLWFLFWVAALASAVYYLVRLLGFVRERVLWRLRRRLIVAYVFIAFVPILLILLLVGIGAFIVNGQLAAFLVASKLRQRSDELLQLNRAVSHGALPVRQAAYAGPDALLDQVQTLYVTGLARHAASYPGLEITLQVGPAPALAAHGAGPAEGSAMSRARSGLRPAGGSKFRAFHLDGRPAHNPLTAPAWFKREEFAGIVMDRPSAEGLALRAVSRGTTPLGDLVVILSQPFTPELLDLVGQEIGPVGVVITRPEEPGAPPSSGLRVDTPKGAYVQSAIINSKSVQVPEPLNRFDFTVFGASSLDPVLWSSEKEEKAPAPVFVYVTSRILTLNTALLAALGDYSRIPVILFKVLVVVFLLLEGVALIIGVRLTRSITVTVDKLHDATERVKGGDFAYRMGMPPRDQLSALGGAFDSMTASVERLLSESQEKSRLESELEIARQVQTQLFPRVAPEVPGLKLYGVCKAARTVSGDYYDFLKLGEDRIALVLGDVSGKGISAALLMAAIQSALRAQFYDGYALPVNGRAGPSRQPTGEKALSTAAVVERLNRQLYENTPEEKYVTFFFAQYEARARRLTYTNAGHLPPVLFRKDRVERLKTGGTVVGLFWPLTYEQAEIQLEPGDLLLAFTDGITEPENTYGEEFGEDRVLEVARRARHSSPELLVEEIYRSVNDWTGTPELQDDMTLLVAKAVE
jgi:sigma-B regulation protein RsbU (phosphoserine phosphatase)